MKTYLFRIGNIGPFYTIKVEAETECEARQKALTLLPNKGSSLRVWWNTNTREEACLCFDPTNITAEMLELVEVDEDPQPSS